MYNPIRDYRRVFSRSPHCSIHHSKEVAVLLFLNYLSIISELHPYWLDGPLLAACRRCNSNVEIGCLMVHLLAYGCLVSLLPLSFGLIYLFNDVIKLYNRRRIAIRARNYIDGIKHGTAEFLSDQTRLPLDICRIINEYRVLESPFLQPETHFGHAMIRPPGLVCKIEHRQDLLILSMTNGERLCRNLPNSASKHKHSNASVEVKFVYPHDVVLFLNGCPRILYECDWYCQGIAYWGYTDKMDEFLIFAEEVVHFFSITRSGLQLEKGWY